MKDELKVIEMVSAGAMSCHYAIEKCGGVSSHKYVATFARQQDADEYVSMKKELDEARKENEKLRNELYLYKPVESGEKVYWSTNEEITNLKAKLEEAEKEIEKLKEKVKNPYPPELDVGEFYKD